MTLKTTEEGMISDTRTFIISSHDIAARAAETILNLPDSPLHEVVVREHIKNRTPPQNSRYWVSLNEHLRQMNLAVELISNRTGYTPLEVRRLIAKDMPAEYIAILFARTAESAHEVMKAICGIPTSTKLGTKKFSEFDDLMANTIAEIMGYINAVMDKAG